MGSPASQGDFLLDNADNLKALDKIFAEKATGYNLQLKHFSVKDSSMFGAGKHIGPGQPPYVLNYLGMSAFLDDDPRIDYFYQVNDDLDIQSPGWAPEMTAMLRGNANIGVVSPWDLRNTGPFTQAMVHRTHFNAFATFYPKEIQNWYSDDWIKRIYCAGSDEENDCSTLVSGDCSGNAFRSRNHKVLNTNAEGTRYKPVHVVAEDFAALVTRSRKLISEMVATHPHKNSCVNGTIIG